METKERVRANTPGLSRRALLKAAPALALVGAAPTMAQADTPVVALFREWKAHNDWLNNHAVNHVDDDEFDALCDHDMDMINALISTPAQNMHDLCLKLIVGTDYGQFTVYAKLTGAELLKQEARALIGA